jgi:excisionase family DNA binding protein
MIINSPNQFLTPREVAELLRVNLLTIYEYIRTRQLNAVKLGRTYRINVDEVRRFIADHLQGSHEQ